MCECVAFALRVNYFLGAIRSDAISSKLHCPCYLVLLFVFACNQPILWRGGGGRPRQSHHSHPPRTKIIKKSVRRRARQFTARHQPQHQFLIGSFNKSFIFSSSVFLLSCTLCPGASNSTRGRLLLLRTAKFIPTPSSSCEKS